MSKKKVSKKKASAEITLNQGKADLGRERPLSPHLQVYKPQITSALSIFHRASIITMYFAALAFVYFLYLQAFPFECACAAWLTGSETGQLIAKIALSGLALASSYWVCATIRHLFWDIGKGFEIKTAYKTGYLSIACTLVLTIAIIYFGKIW